MRLIWLTLLAVVLSTTHTLGATDEALVALSIRTYQEVEAIRSEMRDAASDLADKKRAYELAIRELDAPPKTPDQLDKLAAGIKRHAAIIKHGQDGNGSEASIAYSQKRVHDLSLILEASKLKTDAGREAFRQKYQPRIDELTNKIQAIQAPYRVRIQDTQQPVRAENGALAEMIRTHFKTPNAAYPDSSVGQVNATVYMAFAASHWSDRNDKQIAWAHIRIRSLDEIEDYHRENLLDGKYPIQSLSDGSIWVWAGHFLITFVADDDSLKGKENIQQAIHQFIDLEGLAAISTGSEQVAAGAKAMAE